MATLCAALAAFALPGASARGGSGGNRAATPAPPGPRISRTEYGIPHILAHDYSDLGYGYGYAFAQDNACQLADRVLTLRGQRSAYFGGAARTNDTLGGTATNLDSDTYFLGLRRSGTIARLLARPAPLGPSAELRQLVAGYAAGFDRYLKDVGVANLPDPSCQGQPWVQPITAEDVWTNILDISQADGAAALRDEIGAATPPSPSPVPAAASKTESAAASAAALSGPLAALSALSAPSASSDQPSAAAGARGSNGWAFGADATAAHDGLVLANPHLPWIGDARFYQVQLTIPGVLDVSGAALYGTPAVEIGHTAGLAWAQTTTDSQHMSLYQLQLVPGDPTSYLVDDHPEPMRRQQVPVPVLGADGTVSTVLRTLYSSRYGPVLADGWTTATAVTMRDANADDIRSMDQWLAMDRAQNIGQLRAAQHRYQGSPWVYTLAADSTGAAYFTDSSATPHLSDAQLASCTLAPIPGVALPLLDGSGTACDWGSDPDAAEPGLYGPAAAPELLRHDYVANSNNDPVQTNPAVPLSGYPKVYGTSPRLGLRPQNGLAMIGGRLAGTDGLGPAGFTLPTLRTLTFDDSDRSAQIGLADVLAMCRANPTLTTTDGTAVDTAAACTALAGWDGRGGVDSRGQVFWSAFFTRLTRTTGPDPAWWRTPYDPTRPLTTPRGIDGGNPAVQKAFADTIQATTARGGTVTAAPGDVNRWNGVPLHGCSDTEGCFDLVSTSATGGQNGGTDTSPVNWAVGTSFVMAVELTPTGPKADTLMTYSESANPASPHYADQTALFSRSGWVTERFTAADIAASPALTVTTLHR